VKQLHAEGATIVAYDPAAMTRAEALLPPGTVTFAESAYAACAGADALLILAEWPEFAELDLRLISGMLNLPIVLDGKNLLDPVRVREAGLQYYGVGCCPDVGRAPMPSEDSAWIATITDNSGESIESNVA
jgi:UDPglucose 6-dehydrogenase